MMKQDVSFLTPLSNAVSFSPILLTVTYKALREHTATLMLLDPTSDLMVAVFLIKIH